MKLHFPLILQADSSDCGVASLAMIAEWYGIYVDYDTLRQHCLVSRVGVSLLTINKQAQELGFKTEAVQLNFENLQAEKKQMPCIVFWNNEHFVVVRRITSHKVLVADPALGNLSYTHADFKKSWCCNGNEGIALLMTPPEGKISKETTASKPSLIKQLLYYTKNQRTQFIKAATLLALTSIIQLIIPFLTQSVVDVGITNKNVNALMAILLAQGGLIIGSMISNFWREWITLKISAHINISMISTFIEKLLHLPMPFFESKNKADILQRISDFDRIDDFITQSSLSFLFAIVLFIVYGTILTIYSMKMLGIFLICGALYLCWILLFVSRRRVLDNTYFYRMAKMQLNTIEIAEGASEIRLCDGQNLFRNKWRKRQEQV